MSRVETSHEWGDAYSPEMQAALAAWNRRIDEQIFGYLLSLDYIGWELENLQGLS